MQPSGSIRASILGPIGGWRGDSGFPGGSSPPPVCDGVPSLGRGNGRCGPRAPDHGSGVWLACSAAKASFMMWKTAVLST